MRSQIENNTFTIL